MWFQPPSTIPLLLLAALSGSCLAASEPAKTTSTAPCTASSTSGAFYDLRPDIAVAVKEGVKPKKGIPTADYLARGHDYGPNANFTMNICDAVVKPVKDVVGLDKALWKNVSAYYEAGGKVYSLGQQSSVLVSRGRELVLQYTGGSPCPEPSDRDKRSSAVHDNASNKHHDYDDDDDEDSYEGKDSSNVKEKDKDTDKDRDRDKDKSKEKASTKRRKSATFAFLCDRDPLDTSALVSFVSTPDECAYFFKIRSQHACAGAEPHKPGSVGPGGVFAIIFFVALLVYFIGGVFYQRTVTHARGWRQLPNYSLWASIWSFVKDFAIILTSSCARFIPRRRGYRSLSISPTERVRNRDDENRLIDQLDEEWDD